MEVSQPNTSTRWIGRLVVPVCLLISALHGAWNIARFSYAGQDYYEHFGLLRRAQSGIISFQVTNPPGFYLFSSYASRFFPASYEMEGLALMQMILNLLVLGLWYYVLRQIITNAWIRLACFAVLTFLPVRTVTSVVFAPDALTVLPMILTVIVVAWQGQATRTLALMLISGALTFIGFSGMTIKYTFVALPVGAILLGVFWATRRQAIGTRMGRIAGLSFQTIAALLMITWMYTQMKAGNSIHFSNTQRGEGITWGALVGLTKNDLRIFSAPEFTCGQPMAAAQGLSYISLLHLGTFSDVWQFFQQPHQHIFLIDRPLAECFARFRPYLAKTLTPMALVLSVPITLLALVGTAYQLGIRGFKNLYQSGWNNDLRLTIGLISLILFIPPVARLPYYETAYVFGFWTPRLVLASVLGFIVLGFALLDDLLRGRRPWIGKVIFGYCVALSVIWLLTL